MLIVNSTSVLRLFVSALLLSGSVSISFAATKPKAKPATAAPAATPKAEPEAVKPAASESAGDKKKSEGEIEDINVKGQYKGQLQVGKLDPPAAFNLEDIQNFPEERLHPVLNNPIHFEEGRDFSAMMDFEEEKMAHPWLPDFPQAPFLTMNGSVDSSAKDWTFSIIDQAAGAVWKQQGKGVPPNELSWNGEDKERGYVAVDTVYIPQISITNKEGYHRTYPGQPAQFSAIRYADNKGKNVIELSTKALFQDKKTQFTKEGKILLEKVTDVIREEGKIPFSIRPYDMDPELAKTRQKALATYLKDTLYIAESQIILSDVESPEKRGNAFAIVLNATPGGSN